ncbi:FG-GAP repeat domain-containing protein [Streptomyces sp. NPDC021100]|uniref:FG-GAP repeat domain-containing protein n=1 Tax=Streptomyces sp. NPDC021100 TaxID=3365114 RepID=UPI00379572A0
MLTYTGHSGSFAGNGRQDLLVRHGSELFVYPGTGALDGLKTYGERILIHADLQPDHYLWVGAGDFTGDGRSDVFALTIEEQGYIFLNRGGLDGPNTLADPVHIGGKLPDIAYDTIALADMNDDGKTDIIGRQAGTARIDIIPFGGEVDGLQSFAPPIRLATLGPTDIPLGAADVTGGGRVELLVLRDNGDLAVHRPADRGFDADGEPLGEGEWFTLGHGWDDLRIVDVTDINGNGRPDLLGLRADGTLVAHAHSGTFDPADPSGLYGEPVVVAEGWDDVNAIS